VRFDDPDIGIDWGLETTPVLSAKDEAAVSLAALDNPFVYEGDA
jgi:dTDP-4-dehydrorhamnose 3,5-epimerase